MREKLAGFIRRLGEILKEGKIPERFYDVSSLYQLARGNPAVREALAGGEATMPLLPPVKEPDYFLLYLFDEDDQPGVFETAELAWREVHREEEFQAEEEEVGEALGWDEDPLGKDAAFNPADCRVVPVWIGEPVPDLREAPGRRV